jgi:hypothetical protein
MIPAVFPHPLLLVYFTGALEFMGGRIAGAEISITRGSLPDPDVDRDVSGQCERSAKG